MASEIAKAPDSFFGKTVMLEGDIHMSSKGVEDFWYVLFDDSGSSVVRSKQEIPFDKARVSGTVQKTRLGQVYLDVVKFEKS